MRKDENCQHENKRAPVWGVKQTSNWGCNSSSQELGPGFLESIYEQAFKVELSESGLGFHSQKEIKVEYSGVEVGMHRLDLVVEKEIIVELKAVRELSDINFAQLQSYLKATSMKVRLLLNFLKPTLEVRRVVN